MGTFVDLEPAGAATRIGKRPRRMLKKVGIVRP